MGRPRKYHTEAEIKEAKRLNAKKTYQKKVSDILHCVYIHYNDKNIYIGSGNIHRPYKMSWSSRSNKWHSMFPEAPKVKIIKEFTDSNEARSYEYQLIEKFNKGGFNLANIHKNYK